MPNDGIEPNRPARRGRRLAIATLCGLVLVLTGTALTGSWVFGSANADSGPGGSGSGGDLEPLSASPPPLPSGLSRFVKSRTAAARLGKVLFYDMQVGSDGLTACATCHFAAGIDARSNDTVFGRSDGFDPGLSVLDASDFPFDTNDVVGSQGVQQLGTFIGLTPNSPVDSCTGSATGPRQVTGRNAPSMIMSVFSTDNFWDGRASHVFNGINPGGQPGQTPTVLVDKNGALQPLSVALSPASSASQAVGPANNAVEMSCAGRTFRDLGRKLINNGLKPLGLQEVHSTDSLLAPLDKPTGPGLKTTATYAQLIKDAFAADLWRSTKTVNGYTQMENNFALFWGLAIREWAATLIPSQAPLDRFLAGDGSALSASARLGLDVFNGEGRCIQCHGGAELTNASVNVGGNGREFANTALRPTAEDPGRSQGEFKTPTLRNVELTGPYFHNGGYLTLRQVVDFYNRGGDFPGDEVDSQVRPLDLSEAEKVGLVDFLLALTDPRVRCEKGPFDHPALTVPGGPSLPAVGAGGRSGPCLTPFLGASHHTP